VVPSHSNTFFFRKMLMNVSEILNILRICNWIFFEIIISLNKMLFLMLTKVFIVINPITSLGVFRFARIYWLLFNTIKTIVLFFIKFILLKLFFHVYFKINLINMF
jgi:hypothetical protein